eukprot:TRINITY_DN3903_c0_g1_i1.p1 TRINITY_DN3903_c0_g1~~TRINITY_DN3903_c0_g1_i1.p1  ORF type:complete len:143 (-),score=60.51 TRINITY_DN3903_c0_g1_i1:53-481(-)
MSKSVIIVGGIAILIGAYFTRRFLSTKQDLFSVNYEIEEFEVTWLEEVIQKYNLRNISEAIQKIVTFAKNRDREHIFKTIRCTSCDGSKNKVHKEILLDQSNIQFLISATAQFEVPSVDKSLRIILEFARTEENIEQAIFRE